MRPARDQATLRWIPIVALGALVLVATALPVISLGVLGPVLVQVGVLRDPDIGLLTGLFHLGGAASPILGGRLVATVGVKRALVVTAATTAFAAAGLYWSVDLIAWGACMLLAGTAFGAANPATNSLVGDALRNTPQLGMATGIKQSGVPAASIVAAFILLPTASAHGWRWAYVAMAGLAVALALGMAFTARHAAPAPVVATRPRRPVLDVRRVLVLSGYGLLMGAGMTAFSAYLALSLTQTLGMDPGVAGRAVAVAAIAGIASRILIAARAARGAPLRFFPPLAWGSVGAVAMLLAAQSLTELLVWPAVLLGGVFIFGWTGTFHLALVRSGDAAAIAAVSGRALTGFGVGLMAGGPAFSLAVSVASFEWAWLLVLAMFALAAVLVTLDGRDGSSP